MSNKRIVSSPEKKKKSAFRRSVRKKLHMACRWFISDRPLMIISLILSVICWCLVTLNITTNDTKTINDVPIKIDTTDLEETFHLHLIDIVDPPALSSAKVDVTLTGSIYQLSRVTADDVSVVAQVSGVSRAGEYTLSLVPTCSVRDVSISINNNYDFVKVWFDRIQQKDFSVDKVIANGVSTSEGLIIGNYVSSVKSLTLSGPESVIENISSVQVRADINKEISESYQTNGTICYIDIDGAELGSDMQEFLTIVDYNNSKEETGTAAGAPLAEDITVIVPIMKTVELPLALNFKNASDSLNTNSLKYTINPPRITLEGDIDAIDKLAEAGVFYVDGVDLSTLSPSNNRFTLKLNLSNGIEEQNGVSEVNVAFNLVGYSSRKLSIANNGSFQLINADDINAKITTDSLDITVFGPSESIDNLTRANFAVSVDMDETDETSGQRKMAATVSIKGHNDCWVYGTYTVMVTVE